MYLAHSCMLRERQECLVNELQFLLQSQRKVDEAIDLHEYNAKAYNQAPRPARAASQEGQSVIVENEKIRAA